MRRVYFRSIRDIITDVQESRPTPPKRSAVVRDFRPVGPKSKLKAPAQCKCGTCPRCLDNAKWERRFNELFGKEMKAYYNQGLNITRGSSLA